eukprot:997281-Prymnesium_polylepis.2
MLICSQAVMPARIAMRCTTPGRGEQPSASPRGERAAPGAPSGLIELHVAPLGRLARGDRQHRPRWVGGVGDGAARPVEPRGPPRRRAKLQRA